jgi:hypothetical protein
VALEKGDQPGVVTSVRAPLAARLAPGPVIAAGVEEDDDSGEKRR